MKGKSNSIRLLVILLLIFSVAASSFYISEETQATEKTSKEQASKDKKKDAPEISKPSDMEAVVPFFVFDTTKDLYLILKLNFQSELQEEVYHSEPLYTSKYFKTLFCFVISPNAP